MTSQPFFIDRTIKSRHANKTMMNMELARPRKILVVAGVHGNEHNAVLAAYRFMGAIESDDTFLDSCTEIRFILGANRYGLMNNTREWGEPDCAKNEAGDPVDLNRVFKEDDCPKNSSLQEIMRTLSTAVEASDIVIDIHNSPAMTPCVLLNNDTHTKEFVKFCSDTGTRYIIQESTTNTLKRYALSKGKIAFTVELGGMTVSPWHDEIVADQYMFLRTFIPDLYMASDMDIDELHSEANPLKPSDIMCALPARCYGMVEYEEDALSREFKAGEPIAHIITGDGLLGEDVIAPCDGWVACCTPTLFVRPGDEYVYWQPKVQE